MKSLTILALVAHLVASQDPLSCPEVDSDTAFLDDAIRPIADALVAINGTVVALDTLVTAYEGTSAQVQALLSQSDTVLNTINSRTQALNSIPPLNDTNQGLALSLATYTQSLGCTVNTTVDDVINRRQTFIDSCEGPTVLQVITGQQTASSALNVTILSKLTEAYRSVALSLEQPIFDALAAGIAAFADQTTLPASCSSTSTTTASAPTTSTTTTSTSPLSTPTVSASTTTTLTGSYSPIVVTKSSAVYSGSYPGSSYTPSPPKPGSAAGSSGYAASSRPADGNNPPSSVQTSVPKGPYGSGGDGQNQGSSGPGASVAAGNSASAATTSRGGNGGTQVYTGDASTTATNVFRALVFAPLIAVLL